MRFFRNAKRPVFWMGQGIRLAGAADLIPEFLERYKVPTVLSWSGADMVDSDHPLVFGRVGVYGQRCANTVVEEADAIIAIGTRLSLLQIGYDRKKIKARLAVVDNDAAEANKWTPEVQYVMDAGEFMRKEDQDYQAPYEWITKCSQWRSMYPWVESPAHDDNGYCNSYRFMEVISRHLRYDQIIVTDVAGPNICAHQALRLKPPQRLITSQGLGEMGVGLPFAIGASFARQRGEILCLHSDGAMMMNLQELQTIAHHRLPIKIIVFSNDGYLMIKHTQNSMFGGHRVGVNQSSGVSMPMFDAIAAVMGITSRVLSKPHHADEAMRWLMAENGPALLEVIMDPEQPYVPRLQAIRNADGSVSSPKLSQLSPHA